MMKIEDIYYVVSPSNVQMLREVNAGHIKYSHATRQEYISQ